MVVGFIKVISNSDQDLTLLPLEVASPNSNASPDITHLLHSSHWDEVEQLVLVVQRVLRESGHVIRTEHDHAHTAHLNHPPRLHTAHEGIRNTPSDLQHLTTIR